MLTTTFSQYIYATKLNIDDEKIVTSLKREAFELIGGKSNPRAFSRLTVSKNLFLKEAYKELYDQCKIHVIKLIKDCYCLDQSFKIYTSWGTSMPLHGGFVQAHMHSNSWICGVYYPQNHPNSCLRIFNKNQNLLINSPPQNSNQYNSETLDINVEKGNLIMFQADTLHSILPNNTDQERFSIAFNVLPTGVFGEGECRVNLEVQNADD